MSRRKPEVLGPGICPACQQARPPSKKCAAKSKRTGERCQLWATPGKNVCTYHGSRAGRPASSYRYAQVMDKCPELKGHYDRLMEEVDNLGGRVDLSVAHEITLMRARIMAALETLGRDDDKPGVDAKIIQEMIRDVTRTSQKEREIEIGLQNLVPMAKVKAMLQASIQCVTRFVAAASQEECYEELSRILQPFQETLESVVPALPEAVHAEG